MSKNSALSSHELPISSLPLNKIKPKNKHQKKYLKFLDEHEIVICSGVSGVGKTLLTLSYSLKNIMNGKFDKIILMRPLVTTEDVGYLPGSLSEKVSPHYQVFSYTIEQLIGEKEQNRLYDQKKIIDFTLAFSRGITFDNSIIIADEFQNATKEQVKLLLTRIGHDSKLIMSGDPDQIDLKRNNDSGLEDAMKRFKAVEGIGVFEFDRNETVRNPVINKILNCYETGYEIENNL